MVFGGLKIGIFGGIGPEASSEHYSKLVAEIQKRCNIKSNLDFPQIIINSYPAPELISDNITEKDLDSYVQALKELDSFEPNFIVMVCNTIHLFYDYLQSKIKARILNLREEVKQNLIDKQIKSVLIIGTSRTIKQGLYRFASIKTFEPDEDELKELTSAIFNFNKGVNKSVQVQKTMKICDKYLKLGAETVILGCTEFAVMLKDQSIPKINTIDILVNATIKKLFECS